ncbi:unnamed protein product [Cylicocyclus nassatus]|uniref:Uncharacterized protein n=1 Tax=Cylicocyclus nassatus TaxID=53992 RepID=A0AA36DPY4_CYLNA|nr:unnamed protein product [Cylicocyclus nassatus]
MASKSRERDDLQTYITPHTQKQQGKYNKYKQGKCGYICNRSGGRGESVIEKEYRKRYVIPKRVLKNCRFVKAHVRGDGVVSVTACFDHLGRKVSAAFLPLSRSDEEKIVSLLPIGLPFQTVGIVAKLCAEWNPDEDERKHERTCYITMRDQHCFPSWSVEGRSSNDDRLSFKTLSSNDEIAAYILLDTEQITGDGFMLAFITVKGEAIWNRTVWETRSTQSVIHSSRQRTQNVVNLPETIDLGNIANGEVDQRVKRLLDTERVLLLTCFICGKRAPEEDEEDQILWISCSNTREYKAWVHVKCSRIGD